VWAWALEWRGGVLFGEKLGGRRRKEGEGEGGGKGEEERFGDDKGWTGLTLRRGRSEPRGLRVGIRQRDAEAEFPQGRRGACGFAAEYHVGGGLEVGTGLLWDGFIRARVLGYIHEEGVQSNGEGKSVGMCSI